MSAGWDFFVKVLFSPFPVKFLCIWGITGKNESIMLECIEMLLEIAPNLLLWTQSSSPVRETRQEEVSVKVNFHIYHY